MDLEFSEEDFSFQKEVREWIAENFPQEMRDRKANSTHLTKEDHVYWQNALYKKGWAGLNWPAEYGGPEFTPTQQYLYDLEMATAGAPMIVPFGLDMVAPVIMKFGNEKQKGMVMNHMLKSNLQKLV